MKKNYITRKVMHKKIFNNAKDAKFFAQTSDSVSIQRHRASVGDEIEYHVFYYVRELVKSEVN